MANSVTIRTTAPGAKEAAADLDKVKTSATNMGTTAKAALGGLGLAASAGFALATKGALEAQDAAGKYAAATGQGVEAGKEFVTSMDGLAGSAGAVGMKFDDLAAVGTTVAQQFGTTGQKTADLTENILEFAKATGGDANQAAGDLEDTLSAYGLTADDAAGFTDNLVASAQKYGTETGPAQLDILRKMSPALQTMGGDLTDGVGFLNLFETAGLDAATAASGLTKAVATLKPGQTLDDLIAQIGSIEDPLQRAQKASEIFGKKAGPALAAAIQPGMTSLDNFKVSAQDAQGAVTDAANGMLTDADKIKGVGDKLLAGARELGQDFGPALMGLSSLGSLAVPLATGIGGVTSKAWTAAAGSSAVTGALKAAAASNVATYLAGLGPVGAALGLTAGAAIGAGVALGASAAITEAAKGDNSPVGMAFHPWSVLAGNAGSDAGQNFGDTFEHDSSLAMSHAIQQTALVFEHDSRPFVDAAANVSEDAATAAANSMEAAVARNKNSLSLWGLVRDKQIADAAAAKEMFDKSARAITGSMADTLRDGKSDIKGAMDDLTWAITHPLALAKQTAQVEAQLTSKKLLDGLSSKNPEIKAQAEQTKARLIAIWESLNGKAYTEGKDTSNQWRLGLGKSYDEAVADARTAANQVNAWLASIDNHVKVNVDVDTTGFGPSAHGHRAGGGPVRKGMPYVVGENQPELFVPDSNGTVLPSVPGSGASDVHVHVHLEGDAAGLFRVIDREQGRQLALAPASAYSRG